MVHVAVPAAGLEALMGTKDKGGKGNKKPAAKSLKEKRLATAEAGHHRQAGQDRLNA